MLAFSKTKPVVDEKGCNDSDDDDDDDDDNDLQKGDFQMEAKMGKKGLMTISDFGGFWPGDFFSLNETGKE